LENLVKQIYASTFLQLQNPSYIRFLDFQECFSAILSLTSATNQSLNKHKSILDVKQFEKNDIEMIEIVFVSFLLS